jgi:hypothetical protein
MLGATRLIASLVITWLFVACISSARVYVEERGEFSQDSEWNTWDWGPYTEDSDDPEHVATQLDRRFTRSLGEALEARGFVHSESDPDFLVAFRTSDIERTVTVEVPAAPRDLQSHHAEGTYQFTRAMLEDRQYQDVELSIYVTGGPGDDLWQATMFLSLDAGEPILLKDLAEDLVERLPFASSK